MRPPAVLLVAALVATVVNIAQFAALEIETGDQYEAVRIKDGHDAVDLVASHFGSTQERFLLYVQLREVAPGATVTVRRSLLSREELVGLGLAGDAVLTGEPLPRVTAEVAADLDRHVVATGTDEDVGPYAIAVADGEVEAITVVRGPERAYLADDRLLTAGGAG